MSTDVRPAGAAWIVAAVLVLDQVVKVGVKLSFALAERVSWIPGAFDIQFIENDGMAFGWALPGATGKYILTAFRVVAVVLLLVVVVLLLGSASPRWWPRHRTSSPMATKSLQPVLSTPHASGLTSLQSRPTWMG